jgi:hypothetical protein
MDTQTKNEILKYQYELLTSGAVVVHCTKTTADEQGYAVDRDEAIPAGPTMPTMRASRDGPRRKSIRMVPENTRSTWATRELPGNARSMGALSFRLADETASGIKAEQYARIIEAATTELADYGLVPNWAWRGSGDRFSVELAITDWDLLDEEAEAEDAEEED